MSFNGPPQMPNKQESHEEIEISLVKPEDVGELATIGWRAQRALHERESLNNANIPTAEDIDADNAEAINPEYIRAREEQWRELPENPKERYFVARQNGKIIGYCQVERGEEHNQIINIQIDPDAQGKGLGKKFWNEALKFFDPTKESVVMVLPYNSQAMGYYRSLGFEETGGKAHDGKGHVMKSGAIMPVPIEMMRKADNPKPEE